MIKGATICRNVLQRCIAPMQRIAAKNATQHFWAGLKSSELSTNTAHRRRMFCNDDDAYWDSPD
jgi:hypothetical protein